jgi:cytochrome c5
VQAPSGKSVRDGAFTAAQASRGSATYTVYCTTCHMDDLSGGGTFGMETAPPLLNCGRIQSR